MGDIQKLLSEFIEIENDPYRRIIEASTSRSAPVIAYLPPDIPEELIHAAGALSFAILGGAQGESTLGTTVPSFVCPPVRIALANAERGKLSFAGGFVFPYICDSTKTLSQVWRPYASNAFTHALCFPKKCDEDGAHAFLVAEFLRLKDRLEVLAGTRVSDEMLRESIRLHNQNRELLRQLAEGVRTGRIQLTTAQYYLVVRASMLIPKEDHTALLQQLLEGKGSRSPADDDRVRVFLYGYWAEPRSLFSDFERAGIHIVADNLHDGARYFEVDVAEVGDPMDALARRHAQRSPLSCFHHAAHLRRQYLETEVKSHKVEGVIHVSPARCDPIEFDYPNVRQILEDLGVPILRLETEFSTAPDAQARNRIEAFGEMLRGRRDDLDD